MFHRALVLLLLATGLTACPEQPGKKEEPKAEAKAPAEAKGADPAPAAK